jgi:hypothetical protein
MDAPLDHRRLQIRVHQARLAETAPPARARAVAEPRWRRMEARAVLLARSIRRIRRVARRILVVPGPEPVPGAAPAMLGRHPRPEGPPC